MSSITQSLDLTRVVEKKIPKSRLASTQNPLWSYKIFQKTCVALWFWMLCTLTQHGLRKNLIDMKAIAIVKINVTV